MTNDKPLTPEQEHDLRRIELEIKLGLPNAHTGPFPKTKRCAKHQLMCGDCGEYAAKISWKDDVRDSNTWFFAECDVCENVFCEDCIDEGDERSTCYTCIESEVIKSLNQKDSTK